MKVGESKIDWGIVLSLNYQCPICNRVHTIKLKREDFLEAMSRENWESVGFGYNQCGKYDISIRGQILITCGKKAEHLPPPKAVREFTEEEYQALLHLVNMQLAEEEGKYRPPTLQLILKEPEKRKTFFTALKQKLLDKIKTIVIERG